MNLLYINHSDYLTSAWAGGITRQIAIHPQGAQYADRTFAWRVSSARVDLEQSDFTPLPDYDRFISVISGSIRLSHEGGPWVRLMPYQVHAFDGAAATRCLGRCTDFNLMLRKGVCQGSLQAETLPADGALNLHKPAHQSLVIYCAEGFVEAITADDSLALHAGDALLLEGNAGGLALKSAPGAVLLIARAQMESP